MIAWLLARPRLLAYGLGALALAGGLWWVAHTVSQWREAYRERPALVAARDQAIAAQHRSETAVARQVAVNQEIERETVRRLAAADAAARDLARRLLQALRAPRPVCPVAPAAGDPHGTAGEPASGGEVEEATAGLFAAADRDAARLNALQGYVRVLPRRCVPD